MKGILLAGGHGTRLRPLTSTGNKHMIPIANEPMLFYGLRHLAAGGISDVGIVLGTVNEGITQAVGDGGAFGLRVQYIRQGEPRGLADALLCARDFLDDEPFLMYLGDNLLQSGVEPFVRRFRDARVDAVIGVTPVSHPGSYGVVEMDGERIVSIVEKPASPRSNLALVGVYLFTPSILPIVRGLRPSRRGELEITDAIWRLHEQGAPIAVQRVDGWWKDTGRPEDLLEANDLVLRTLPAERFVRAGTVADGAELHGHVGLGRGAYVGPEVRLEGPVVVGNDTRLEGRARIGPGTAVGDRCTVRDSALSRAIVMEGSEISGPVELTDSIVGRSATIRARGPGPVRLSCTLGDSTELRL